MRALATTLVVALAVCASTASAQVRQPRFYVSAGVSGQVTSPDFTPRLTFPLFEEDAEIRGSVAPGTGAHLDIGGGVRLWRRLAAGMQVSRAKSSGRMESTYTLPYPFLFSAARSATLETGTRRSILDVHLQARLDLFRTGSWKATVFGGPSFTWLDQVLAPDRIDYTYVYPFDEIQLREGGDGQTSGQGPGGHLGFTVVRQLRPRVSLEGLVRWNRATLDLETDLGNARVRTGGLQIGGGLQVRF